ncbi:MAG TPA: hypothetical protein V6C46_05845 [Coleofasciculaceae cyanobacterium]
MAVAGEVVPWLDNYPILRQLWTGTPAPGAELDLVPTSRVLTVRFRDAGGVVRLTSTEVSTNPLIRLIDQSRGLVEVCVTGDAWNSLNYETTYQCEILAYGVQRDSFTFSADLPDPREDVLNGCEVYASPRQLLEVMGAVPGAIVQTTVDLSGGWTLNPRGYWVKTIPASQQLYGLWVNDRYATPVEYGDLALGSNRAWARVATNGTNHTLFYKGPESLNATTIPISVETAFNAQVLRVLQTATLEVERRCSRGFSQRRIFREIHSGGSRNRQLSLYSLPVTPDRYFRLDCFGFARQIRRRYTEDDVSYGDASGKPIHINRKTGVVTLNQTLFDWSDDNLLSVSGAWGLFNTFPKGADNIEVTYTTGDEYPPADIGRATALIAAQPLAIYWQQAMSQGLSALSIGCVSLNFNQLTDRYFPQWQQEITAILDAHQFYPVEAF